MYTLHLLWTAVRIPAILILHYSSIFITAIDASTAFDRGNHKTLVDKLCSQQAPPCFVGLIMNWYSKLYSCVRWKGVFSEFFRVSCDVRQGGILSANLFNLYVLMTCLYYCISLVTDVMFLKRSLGASYMPTIWYLFHLLLVGFRLWLIFVLILVLVMTLYPIPIRLSLCMLVIQFTVVLYIRYIWLAVLLLGSIDWNT